MDPFFKLKHIKPITHGGVRWVFEHPDDPDLLIKIIRHDAIDDRFGKNTKWYKRPRRYGKYLCYIREIQEFITIHAKHDIHYPHLQRIVGFAQTDLGLGLIVQAMKDENNNLAPTLRILIDTGRYDEAAEKALKIFLDLLLDSEIIINDLNPGNIVYAHDEELGHYFAMIDGLGNNSPIPFKSISNRLNQRSKRKRFMGLYAKIKHFKKVSGLYES